MTLITHHSRSPLIRINWDDAPSGYAENPDNWIFSLKIGYIGSLNWKTFLITAILGAIFIYVTIKH